MLACLGQRTVQNMEPGYHRIGSVHADIWQAGTNRAGPGRIKIYYGPECKVLEQKTAKVWSTTFFQKNSCLLNFNHKIYDILVFC